MKFDILDSKPFIDNKFRFIRSLELNFDFNLIDILNNVNIIKSIDKPEPQEYEILVYNKDSNIYECILNPEFKLFIHKNTKAEKYLSIYNLDDNYTLLKPNKSTDIFYNNSWKTKKEIGIIEIENHNNKIKSELLELDLKSIRAIRENNSQFISEHENKAIELRKQLK